MKRLFFYTKLNKKIHQNTLIVTSFQDFFGELTYVIASVYDLFVDLFNIKMINAKIQ